MYTPEQIRQCISWLAGNFRVTADGKYRECADILAATLKAAQGGATEAMVRDALDYIGFPKGPDGEYAPATVSRMRAALSDQRGQGDVAEREYMARDFYEDAKAGRVPWPGDTAPPAQPAERVPDGWKLAMFVLQSDLFAKLPEEERAVCEALIAENPYINLPASPAPSPARGDAGEVRSHRWDKDGERRVVCGDKDWMGGPCNGPRTATTQDTRP